MQRTMPSAPLASSHPEAVARLAARVQRLEASYRWIQQERMQDVPVLHSGLRVQAVGFEQVAPEPWHAQGVLITPWFMSLVHMPLQADLGHQGCAEALQTWRFGHQDMPCLATPTPGLGTLWLCSLYSPMQAFVDQAQAVQSALAVLDFLRQAQVATPAPPASASRPSSAVPVPEPSRRTFLMGRG